MKLSTIKNTIQKNSPEILMGVGVIGVISSTILACKQTAKANDILNEKNDKVKEARANFAEDKKACDKAIATEYAKTGVKLVQVYAPAAAIGVASIGCIFGSHDILKKRNIALSAAYTATDKSFKRYREKVVEKFGEAVDDELRFDITKEKETETVVDENGKKKKVKKDVEVSHIDENGLSPYSFFFMPPSRCWNKDPEINLAFLQSQEKIFNAQLKAKGRVFLNEVLEALDLPVTKAGQIVGWVYDPESDGDNFIDFGIRTMRNDRFIEGAENVVLLDFNVDGDVWSSMMDAEY